LEKYEIERIRDNVRERVLTIIIASLGLMAALAWDEALKHLLKHYSAEPELCLNNFLLP